MLILTSLFNKAYAIGTYSGTVIKSGNLKINSLNSTTNNITISSDTVTTPIYGIDWVDTYYGKPIQNSVQYMRPGENIGFTYKFINKSNSYDTFYIQLSNFKYTGDSPGIWSTEIYNSDYSIKYGDTDCYIYNVEPDIEITFNVSIKSDAIAGSNSSAGCSIGIKTFSVPVDEYLGDRNDSYGGKSYITDTVDNETSYVIVRYPQIEIASPDNFIDTNVNTINLAGTSLYSYIGDTVKLSVNSQVYDTFHITDTEIWNREVILNTSGTNIINADIIDMFNRTLWSDSITIRFSDTAQVWFNYDTDEFDTNETTIPVKINIEGSNNGDTINLWLNNELYDSLILPGDTLFNINLLYDTEQKKQNILVAEFINKFNKTVYDTLIVNTDFESPDAVDNSSISHYLTFSDTLNIKLSWNRPQMINDDINGYNVYKQISGYDTINFIGNTETELFIDTDIHYNKSYTYYLETYDNFNNKSDSQNCIINISEIISPDSIPQLTVRLRTYIDTHSLNICLNDENGNLLNSFDSYNINVETVNPSSELEFHDTEIVIANCYAEFILNKTDIVSENIIINFMSKEFPITLIFKSDNNDTQPPIQYISKMYKQFYSMVVIPESHYNNYFNQIDTNIRVAVKPDNKWTTSLNSKINNADNDLLQTTDFIPMHFANNNLSAVREFKILKSDNSAITNFADSYVTLYFSYPDINSDNIVDGTVINNKGITVDTLKYFYLNETTEQWQELSDEYINTENKNIHVNVNHFSVFMVAGKQFTTGNNLNNVKVYPNPYKPNSGLGHTNIKFDNLQKNTTIKIFTITGKLMFESNSGNNAYYNWNVKNNSGNNIASGVYVYLLEYPGSKKIGKLLIIK